MMNHYFNDSPIEVPEDDLFGINPFALSLAKSITAIEKPRGTTLAINGPWGSGKSSAVNLIRNSLEKNSDGNIEVVEFKCWWFSGEEALTLAFLQQLNSTLRSSLGEKVKDLIPKIGKQLLQAGPAIGAAASMAGGGGLGSLLSTSTDFVSKLFEEKNPLEKLFHKLSKILDEQDKRFLVIIDDIDRLSPDEALAVFKLVKSVGQLPNILYLLVYDRELADKVVTEKYPSEGPHFLEKIVQAGFELPMPSQADLDQSFLSRVAEICGKEPESRIVRFMNIFYDGIQPHLITPRHVARLTNAITVTWPSVENDVNLPDFLAMEALRLYEPSVYNRIRVRKDFVLGKDMEKIQRNESGDRVDRLLNELGETKPHLQVIMKRLFPALENVGYGPGFVAQWDKDRRICVEAHFDSYFRLSLSDKTVSKSDLDELISNAGDGEFVKTKILEAARTIRKDGKSKIPPLLDALNSRARDIDRDSVPTFIKAIFEIADDIDRKEDREAGSFHANTRLRIHWLIRRLTEDRFDLQEKTNLYMEATKNASLSWLLDFSHSASEDHNPRKGKEPTSDADCLVAKDALAELNARALKSIEKELEAGSFLARHDLGRNLWKWLDLSNDGGKKLKEWISEKLKTDEGVLAISRAFTGESWSSSMGFEGMGDRVSKRSIIVQFDEGFDLFDPKELRERVGRVIEEASIGEGELSELQQFLEAWDRRKEDDM